jgi:hypothetical protein
MRIIVGMTSVLALTLLACQSSNADGMYPDSFVNIHANGSSVGLSNNYYNGYGNGYYNNYNSSSADGNGGGAAVRFVIPGGLMFDATFNQDTADVGDGNIRINQGTAGVGYQGHMGWGSTWYAEVIYTTFQPRITSNYLCGGSCGTVVYNGAGVKGGFMWPFAGRWYATADLGFAGLQGPSGTDSLAQGIFGGSIGYKFTPNFGVNLAVLSNVWVDGNSNQNGYYNQYGNDTTLSVTSIQAGVSLHF